MASDKPVFCRPIEYVLSGAESFDVGGTDVTLTEGTYGSIQELVYELDDKLNDVDPDYEATINADFKVVIVPLAATVTWTDTGLRDILGFTGNITGTTTATHTPSHCWFPNKAPSNRGRFERDHTKGFAGTQAHDGGLSGISSGDQTYTREYEFEALAANLVVREACVDAYEQARCFETFARDCRTAGITVQGNADPKGFYVFPDYTDASTLTASLNSGGINFNYTSGANTYVFATMPPRGPSSSGFFLPVGIDYYSCGFSVTTCPAQTWNAP